MMADLFDYTPYAKYPESPGFKEETTSKEAAAVIAPKVKNLRDQVMRVLDVAWPNGLTADEVAAKVGRSEFGIRPRLSELRKLNQILPTTVKRPNASGVLARVWVARRPERT